MKICGDGPSSSWASAITAEELAEFVHLIDTASTTQEIAVLTDEVIALRRASPATADDLFELLALRWHVIDGKHLEY